MFWRKNFLFPHQFIQLRTIQTLNQWGESFSHEMFIYPSGGEVTAAGVVAVEERWSRSCGAEFRRTRRLSPQTMTGWLMIIHRTCWGQLSECSNYILSTSNTPKLKDETLGGQISRRGKEISFHEAAGGDVRSVKSNQVVVQNDTILSSSNFFWAAWGGTQQRQGLAWCSRALPGSSS